MNGRIDVDTNKGGTVDERERERSGGLAREVER
jgi:hypothetical protein